VFNLKKYREWQQGKKIARLKSLLWQAESYAYRIGERDLAQSMDTLIRDHYGPSVEM